MTTYAQEAWAVVMVDQVCVYRRSVGASRAEAICQWLVAYGRSPEALKLTGTRLETLWQQERGKHEAVPIVISWELPL